MPVHPVTPFEANVPPRQKFSSPVTEPLPASDEFESMMAELAYMFPEISYVKRVSKMLPEVAVTLTEALSPGSKAAPNGESNTFAVGTSVPPVVPDRTWKLKRLLVPMLHPPPPKAI